MAACLISATHLGEWKSRPLVVQKYNDDRQRCNQYKNSIKFETTITASTPATESDKACLNRISAGTLYRLAVELDVPVRYFFEGLKDRPKKRK